MSLSLIRKVKVKKRVRQRSGLEETKQVNNKKQKKGSTNDKADKHSLQPLTQTVITDFAGQTPEDTALSLWRDPDLDTGTNSNSDMDLDNTLSSVAAPINNNNSNNKFNRISNNNANTTNTNTDPNSQLMSMMKQMMDKQDHMNNKMCSIEDKITNLDLTLAQHSRDMRRINNDVVSLNE